MVKKINELKSKSEEDSLWQNKEKAQSIFKEKSKLENLLNNFKKLESEYEDLVNFNELFKSENDDSLKEELVVTVIATGFHRDDSSDSRPASQEDSFLRRFDKETESAASYSSTSVPVETFEASPLPNEEKESVIASDSQSEPIQSEPSPFTGDSSFSRRDDSPTGVFEDSVNSEVISKDTFGEAVVRADETSDTAVRTEEPFVPVRSVTIDASGQQSVEAVPSESEGVTDPTLDARLGRTTGYDHSQSSPFTPPSDRPVDAAHDRTESQTQGAFISRHAAKEFNNEPNTITPPNADASSFEEPNLSERASSEAVDTSVIKEPESVSKKDDDDDVIDFDVPSFLRKLK